MSDLSSLNDISIRMNLHVLIHNSKPLSMKIAVAGAGAGLPTAAPSYM
jgi:hypothetical protein